MDLNLFSRRDRDLFSFVAWIATFYYPWLGGFFEFVFSEGPRPFFLCSLKSYVLLPVVGWIFWICFTQRTELWVYGEAIISQGCITFYLPGGTRSLNFSKFSSATFLLPVVGWIFWICFLGRPETFFTFDCSLNCCILLPLVGSIFPFCLFSVDLGSLFCWKLEFLFLLLYSELGRLIEWFD